jgi:hypothetical protein
MNYAPVFKHCPWYGRRPLTGWYHQLTQQGVLPMIAEDTIELDTLEIADLEYDVGGMGAVEPAEGRQGNNDFVVVMVYPPK